MIDTIFTFFMAVVIVCVGALFCSVINFICEDDNEDAD